MNNSEKRKFLTDNGFKLNFIESGSGEYITPSDTILIKYRIYYEGNPGTSLFTSTKRGNENPISINGYGDVDMLKGFSMIVGCLREGDAVSATIPPNFQSTLSGKQYKLKLDYKRDVTLNLLIVEVTKNKTIGEENDNN